MKVEQTPIKGVRLLTPKRLGDARGFFVESWHRERFGEHGVDCDFVQDNHSLSVSQGTVRGLHFQAPPRAQAKLVRALRGAIVDIVVDARKSSPTFGQHVRSVLSAENGVQLFVPVGFLHGFATLEPNTEIAYKVSDYYSAEHEGAVRWDDSDLALDWGIAPERAVVSDKDRRAVGWADFASPF